MKKINTKTKAVKKKVVPKRKKIKKIVKKTIPKTRKPKAVKTKNVLGSITAPLIGNLGTKILVQEIKEEPRALSPEVPVEEAIIPQDNLINEQAIIDEVVSDQVDPQAAVEASLPEYQDSAEEYYMQKELSPRQKNIIMWVSLTTIMGVLVFFWGLSIKNSMGQAVFDSDLGGEGIQMLNEFQGVFDDFQNEISGETNQSVQTTRTQALEAAKQQIITNKVKNDIASQLKDKLENLNTNNVNINNTNSN